MLVITLEAKVRKFANTVKESEVDPNDNDKMEGEESEVAGERDVLEATAEDPIVDGHDVAVNDNSVDSNADDDGLDGSEVEPDIEGSHSTITKWICAGPFHSSWTGKDSRLSSVVPLHR